MKNLAFFYLGLVSVVAATVALVIAVNRNRGEFDQAAFLHFASGTLTAIALGCFYWAINGTPGRKDD